MCAHATLCLIYIDAITPCLCHAFLHRRQGKKRKGGAGGFDKNAAYSTPFCAMKMTKYIIHSKSAILRWIYAPHITSCLLSDAGACDAYRQPSQAVSGSDQVVWPSGELRGRQWPHCVAEVPLVSMTLPATETGRSKMAAHGEPCWCLSFV